MLAASKLVGFVPTTDFAVSKPFYADLLGLPVVSEDPTAVTFDAGGNTLRLSMTPPFTPQPFTILGWWVDDIVAMADALAAKGVPGQRYPELDQDERGLWGPPHARVKVLWIQDPEGNILSLTGFVG